MRAGAGALALLVAATGCSAASAREDDVPAAQPAVIGVFPAGAVKDLPPDSPVVVSSTGGVLRDVAVSTGGAPVAGVFSADRTRWRSLRTMLPGAAYTLRVSAVNPDGRVTERNSGFTTRKAAQTFGIEAILPDANMTGLTVGVGMPIMITFDRPITDRVSVERNLEVQSSKPVQGAWHWFDDHDVTFRPKTYWPANTKVRLVARLAGARGGEGMYAAKDVVRDFKIGRSQISVVDTDTHYMKVRRNGKVIREVPISAGKGGEWKYYTTNGIHLAMSREAVTVMTSPGIGPGQPGYYKVTVYDTVRISNSGEYIHAAPWSMGSQGSANVSHGCVNVSPSHAAWFLHNTLIGDPIIVTGTPRRLEPTNGWGHWQENWREWLKWSRLRAATTEPL